MEKNLGGVIQGINIEEKTYKIFKFKLIFLFLIRSIRGIIILYRILFTFQHFSSLEEEGESYADKKSQHE